jgi:outer membrane protein assembly factor BamD
VKHLRTSLLLAVVLTLGCASFGTFNTTLDGEVVFGKDADENLKKGAAAIASKDYQNAAKFYEYVKTKYPYLEAAKTAELKLGDCDFERDKYAEARDRYENFVRIHPTHPEVDYAAYRAALTHYKDIPSDFFLLPPQFEKDQVEFKAALTALTDFTRTYPDSTYVKDAKEALRDVKRRLADHELYVADFYAKRGRWPAVVARLKVVAKSFPGVGYDERVSFGLYEAHLKLHEDAKAYEALQAYVDTFPEDPGVGKARALLAARVVPKVEAPPPTPTPTPTPKVDEKPGAKAAPAPAPARAPR